MIFFFLKKRSMFWVELMDLGFSVTDITLLVWFFIWDLLIIIILQNTPDLSFKAFLTPSSYFYMLTYKKSNLNVVHLQHVGSACEILTVCSRRKKLKSPPQKRGQDLSDLVVIKIFVKPTRNIFPGMIFNNFSVPFSAPKYVDMIWHCLYLSSNPQYS